MRISEISNLSPGIWRGGEEHKGPWDPDHLINFTKQLQGKPRS